MKAVSDTSPLGYLILIAQSELLPKTFSSISIPEQVRDELLDRRAPEAIRRWMSAPPGWLSVAAVDDTNAPPELARLHAGERAAILLAERLNADTLLLDEKAARAVALLRGLHLSGTLGILVDAGRRKLVELPRGGCGPSEDELPRPAGSTPKAVGTKAVTRLDSLTHS